jgi:hypothetical protein
MRPNQSGLLQVTRLTGVMFSDGQFPDWTTFAGYKATKPTSTCIEFDRALDNHLAAARAARAMVIGDLVERFQPRRVLFLGMTVGGLLVYALALKQFHAPSISTLAMLAVFFAALFSSIAGFAFSAICGAMLFHLIDQPVEAVQIMMVCSVGGQALMVWHLRHAIDWRALAPFVLGAAIGLPIGVHILLHTPTDVFMRIIGTFIVLYAAVMILRRPVVVARQHAVFDALAGVLGGVTGGMAAFPGAFVTVWCGLKGWSKERQRGVYQPFILLVQIAAIALIAMPGLRLAHGRSFDFAGIEYLPAMFGGCLFGMGVFRKLNDRQFAFGVNTLLLVSGAALLV